MKKQDYEIRLGCKEVAEIFGFECNCCDSCHNDADEFGFDLLEGRLPDGRPYRICCYISREADL